MSGKRVGSANRASEQWNVAVSSCTPALTVIGCRASEKAKVRRLRPLRLNRLTTGAEDVAFEIKPGSQSYAKPLLRWPPPERLRSTGCQQPWMSAVGCVHAS